MTLPLSENPLSPPASLAPQGEWTFAPHSLQTGAGYIQCEGKDIFPERISKRFAGFVIAAHNSRLREDKKEIERLRKMIEIFRIWGCGGKQYTRIDNLEKVSAQLTVARDSRNTCFAHLIELLLLNGDKDLHDMSSRKAAFSVLCRDLEMQALQGATREEVGIESGHNAATLVAGPKALPEESNEGAGAASQKFKATGSSGPHQSAEESVQGEGEGGVTEWRSSWRDTQAENVFGVRMARDSSRASRRLQQALGRCVAVQSLSREEAQKIYRELVSTDNPSPTEEVKP